jgi:hypothetical protein
MRAASARSRGFPSPPTIQLGGLGICASVEVAGLAPVIVYLLGTQAEDLVQP